MRSTLVLAVAISMLLIFSCKKGDQGDKGDPGLNGNANAVQYNFGAHNFATSAFKHLQISTTADTMNNSSWHVYLFYEPLTRWYFIPGEGFGANTRYRTSIDFAGGKVNIYIDKVGVGEAYSKIRVIRIYTNRQENLGLVPGNRHISSPDVSDYEAMRSFYQLP
ncbi:hypothetical protein [Pseudoflavitalea rhizosphaerae]|uniref:hypothetical protein n=1 Tax=Pseudoflavitalea rhizosphaerae TaxID=1884793 RepID=UPI000F8C8625|nr:hypothetical protein [Pseudoflavitalea rhizosphaerae]